MRILCILLLLLAAASGQARTNLIVFVGDSITYECDWAARLGDPQIVNRGVPGDTTRDIIARMDTVADPRARSYFIMAGINDLKRGIPWAETVSNIRKMIRILRQTSPDAAIVLQSILPVNSRIRPFMFGTSIIPEVNAKIREIARAHGVPVVENKPVAQLLYKTVDVDRAIPEDLYRAVAEILAYVYGLKEKAV